MEIVAKSVHRWHLIVIQSLATAIFTLMNR
jgi:hypothetical protein